ncbi:MAG: hypothetical protein MHMPM18_004045, partial [Marteilia pararefringens]
TFIESLYKLKDIQLNKKIEGFEEEFNRISEIIKLFPETDVDVLLKIKKLLKDLVNKRTYGSIKNLLEIQKKATKVLKNIESGSKMNIEIPLELFLHFQNVKSSLVHLVQKIYRAANGST